MIRVITILVLLTCFFVFEGRAQDKNEIIQSRIEFISEELESESIDLTDIVSQLNYYFDHPLNLNNCTKEQLLELNLLTDVQVNDLLLHRELFGNLISKFELFEVELTSRANNK